MSKITVELVVKIAEITGRIIVIVLDALKGEKHDQSGRTQKK